MKINNKIALACVSSAAIAAAGISAGIGLAAPATPTAAHTTVSAKSVSAMSVAASHRMSSEAIYATSPNTRYLRDHARLTPGMRMRLPGDPQLRKAEYVAMQRRVAAHQEAARDAAAAQAATTTQPAAQTQASTAQPTGGSITAGMSAFERCVAWRESGNNPTASAAGLFGILPATWASLGYPGTAGQASVAVQKVAFNRLYSQYGTWPWAPYDGC